MKKLFSFVLILILALTLVIPSLALSANGNWTEITKKTYDSFTDKHSANNNSVGIGNSITLVSNSKTGWWIVADEGVFGTQEVAYKIGNAYYLVNFEIRKVSRNYFIGDGSGKNGVNQVKIGEFVPHECGNDWVLIERVAANCVEEGFEKYECDWCGNLKTEILPVDPNNHKEPLICEVCNVCSACGECTCEEPLPVVEIVAYAIKGEKDSNHLYVTFYINNEEPVNYDFEVLQSEFGGDGYINTFDNGYTVRFTIENRGGPTGSRLVVNTEIIKYPS